MKILVQILNQLTVRCFERAGQRIALAAVALVSMASVPAAQAQAAGTLDANFDPGISGSYIVATAVQPDGKMIIGGHMTAVMGVPRKYVARLNADGSLDLGFDPCLNSNLTGVAVQDDGKIVVVGSFTTVQPNGAPTPIMRNRIARFNADGSLDTSFDPNLNQYATCVAIQADGKILVAGYFTTVQPNGAAMPATRKYVVRLNTDGTLDSDFDPNPDNHVKSVVVQPDGKILLGGNFWFVQPKGDPNGASRLGIARVHADGSLDSSFDPQASGGVHCLALQADGKILVGGGFTELQPNGAVLPTPRNFIARLNSDGSLDMGFDPSADNIVSSLSVQANGQVLVAGDFTNLQPNGAATATTRRYAARLDANGDLDPVFDPSPNGICNNVSVQEDGKILLGGIFGALQPNAAKNPITRYAFARLNNDAAIQSLQAINANALLWQRSGTEPEVSNVTFEVSSNGGLNWTLLGHGTRVGNGSNWQLTNLALPANCHIRGRGRTAGSEHNGSSGLVETKLYLGNEISVLGNNQEIPNGSTLPQDANHTKFGSVLLGASPKTRIFTIANLGDAILNLTGAPKVKISGPHASAFTVTATPTGQLAPLTGTTSFEIKFIPAFVGLHSATATIENDDSSENPYTFNIEGFGSTVNLTQLVPSQGTLSPAFSSATLNYTVNVTSQVDLIAMTPTTEAADVTLKVQGTKVVSGTSSLVIGLNLGTNYIYVTVDSADGTVTKTYTVVVNRLASSTNANLSNLVPNSGSLSPGFSSGITSYSLTVNNSVTTLSITPTKQESGATIKVNGVSVDSGVASSPIVLSVGNNVITTLVTASNGTTTKTYTINVTRLPANNASLTGLVPNMGVLTPAFNPATTSYTASVGNGTTSMTVIPTAAQAGASIKVNGITVASGTVSPAINLNMAGNVITTVVTAPDGVTTQTYTLTVQKPGLLSLASPVFTVNSGAAATVADISILRSEGHTGPVGCSLSTSDGTASTPGQYAAQNGTPVLFADNEIVQHVLIPIPANAATTTAKTFKVAISNATGEAHIVTQGVATVVILPPAVATENKTPGVTIATPASNALIDDKPQVTVTGIATDDIGVHKVQVSMYKGSAFTDAVVANPGGTSSSYSLAFTPMTGLNTVQVRSIDFKGNISPVLTRTFTQLRTLKVAVNGPTDSGAVTPGFMPSSSRQVGKALTITAMPKAGFVFNGWTANSLAGTGITSASAEVPTLKFTMTTGLELTAKFVANPFQPGITGAYNGLITPSVNVPAPAGTAPGLDTEGMLQNLVVTNNGSFTGVLRIDGLNLKLKGRFDNAGVARFGNARKTTQVIARTGKPNLELSLLLDLTGLTSKVTGHVRQTRYGAVIADSAIMADRANYGTATKVASSLAGSQSMPYTLIFPAMVQPSGLPTKYYPQGDGYATMTVNVKGIVTLGGKLADHTAITASAPLSQTNQWPLFAQLYAAKGSVSGMSSLADAPADKEDVTGELRWYRPFQSTQWYPDGWKEGIDLGLLGARYVVPSAQPAPSVFPGLSGNGSNAVLTFANGLLPAPVKHDVAISTANLATIVPAAASPTLVIATKTGLISGKFVHTDLSKVSYQGAILQKGAAPGARGYFMTTSPKPLNYLGESGSVRVFAKP